MTFKDEIIRAIREYFPDVNLEIQERRDTILEIRAILGEDIFIEIYANFLTAKRSYALISKGRRLIGYDNYKFWHYHPVETPDKHIPCQEPSIPLVLQQMKKVVESLR